jgi:hypothetical protein
MVSAESTSRALTSAALTWMVTALAIFLIGCAVVYQCFSDRQVYFDEVGLYNPVYMYLHFGKMTYPAHDQFDAMYIHPPVYYWLVASMMRTGLSVYHAAGLITVLVYAIFAGFTVWSRFPFPVKCALLFGCFLGAFVWNEALVLRPDLILALSWAAGLVALESARLDGWRMWRLGAGAFLLAFASGVHYPGVASACGLLVYVVWIWLAAPRDRAMKGIGWMAAGAGAFIVPYAVLFALPHAREILTFAFAVQPAAGEGSAFARHMQAYAVWRNAIPYYLTFRPVSTFLTEPLFRWSIPAAFLAPALLAILPSTRGIAVAAMPHMLFLLLLARHKQIGYSGYFAAEVELYLIGAVALLLTITFGAVQKLKKPYVTALAGACMITGLAFAATVDPPALAGTKVTRIRGVYDLEAGHAAGRKMLGPDATVGTTSAGVWYISGATHMQFITPQLLYPADIGCLDRRRFFSLYDAVATDPHQSWASYNKQHISITSSYLDGSLQLRGFFFGDRRLYFESSLSYMLYSVDRPPHLSGYGLRHESVFRFDEAPDGDQIYLTAECPVDAIHHELDNSTLNLDFFATFFKPIPGNIDPREAPDLSVPAAIITLIADRNRIETDISARLGRCVTRDRIAGRFTRTNVSEFIAESDRSDEPMHFYRSFEDYRDHVGHLVGHTALAATRTLPSVCEPNSSTK